MCSRWQEEVHLLVRQLLKHSQTAERLADQGACIWAPLKHGHKHCHASCEQQLHQALLEQDPGAVSTVCVAHLDMHACGDTM